MLRTFTSVEHKIQPLRSLIVLMRRVPKINKAKSVRLSVGIACELHYMELAPLAGARQPGHELQLNLFFVFATVEGF